ncbi:helix-turn-helix transcriptional regulator [Rubinisphaera margarita]|uniref:helix-turn-helix transcriptional regulator n=1 Tax=Rubinisphaera margarita TaxID=2909586 RepID=UPI001EE79A6A|nr:WYL domain-containing protein [Rubinisphaera margarita]MCG6155011.1 WYL domain-containing protein [Rubinisphaera margarita]
MPAMERVRRLLQIVALLQSGKTVNAPDLARECGVSRRTIFRDIENLRDSGLRIEFDEKKQTYRFEQSRFILPADLTGDEVLSLLVVCQDLADARTGIPYLESARTAAFKLASVLPREIRQTVSEVLDMYKVTLDARANLEDTRTFYEQIGKAMKARSPVQIKYDSFTDQRPVSTQLSPYCFHFCHRSWYVIGRSSRHRQIRTFHLKRFESVRVLSTKTYKIPARFSLESYFGNAWRMIREKSQPRHVVVRFAPKTAGNVAEVQWHKTQRIVSHDDGSIDFHVDVEGLDEISWWILGYGDTAEVLEPHELREKIERHARGMLNHYARADGPRPGGRITESSSS